MGTTDDGELGMSTEIEAVLSGERRWGVVQGDCLSVMRKMKDDSVSLVVSSPPYEKARTYFENGQDLGIARDTEEWAKWMVEVCIESRRICRGLCVFVVEGQTRNYRYSCSPFLL